MDSISKITRWILPPIIISGIISNCLNITTLRRTKLKPYSCSMYFLIMSINNLFYVIMCMTYNLLLDGYKIDFAQNSIIFCKYISFLLNFCPQLSIYMLVLASIDRYFASSLNFQRRNLSSLRIAKKIILIVAIVTSLFFIGNAVIFDIFDYGVPVCTVKFDYIFNQIYLTIQIALYVIISPILMIFFGLLTIRNVNRLSRQHIIVFHYRRTERQLTRMLFVQVLAHVVVSLPFCSMFAVLTIPTDFRWTELFYILLSIFKMPFYLSFITPFFLYILSAQLYRAELLRLLRTIIQFSNRCTFQLNGNQVEDIQMHMRR